jgi:Leucine-rich repeat (LRR) protein
MKKHYFLLALFFISFITQSQIVNIPDANFKGHLVENPAINTNNDSEIQVSEALATTTIGIGGTPINNLTGIEAFSNLTTLTMNYVSSLTTINLSKLTNLETLSIRDCTQVQSINFSGLTNLKDFTLVFAAVTTLDLSPATQLQTVNCFMLSNLNSINVSNLQQLTTLNCSITNLPTLDVSGLTALQNLDCSNGYLTNLILTGASSLEVINCFNNQLSSIDLSNLLQLKTLDVSSNIIQALDLNGLSNVEAISCSSNFLTSLDLSQLNPALNPTVRLYQNPLRDVNIKNNINFDQLFPENFAAYCPLLRYVCADEFNIPAILARLQLEGNTNVQVNTYCTFTPGGIYNTITGTQKIDADNNGCDALDTYFPSIKIALSGTDTGATFTNSYGNYSFYSGAGSYTVTPDLENAYYSISPTSATVNFAAVDGATQIQNFCLSPVGVHNDIEITLLPNSPARPGFDSYYKLVYKNKGNQILSGNINFSFDDAVLDLVYAYPSMPNQTLNNLNWSYANLLPFESRTISFTLNVNSPMEIPSVNIGDILNFTASINPIADDETIADNTASLTQTVTGSFDPNDKTCLEGNTITPEMVGKYLHYLIRFQNSGTAAAENIVVKDIIDTTKFDLASLQLTSSSHPQVTKITGNKVEFQFENINLPAEIDDALGSNGYVAFKIKTKNNLVLGNSVSNKADIFFDYNFPIETNTATTTVALLGVNTFENTSVNVTPNPTNNIVHITSTGNISSVKLFDVQGRVLETLTANAEAVDFDLSQKSSGVYFMKVYTVKGVKVAKVIKE